MNLVLRSPERAETNLCKGERGTRPQLTTVEFFTRAVIVVLGALIRVLVWFDVILIVIGAILVAVLLRLVAEPFTRWLRLPESVGLVCSGLVTVAVVAGAGYLFGTQIDAELTEVVQRANSG